MLIIYIVLYVVMGVFLAIAYLTRITGFNNLVIYRKIDNDRILEGETCKISTIIENKKIMPIPFLIMKERMTQGIEYEGEELGKDEIGMVSHVTKYRVGGNSRKVRTYTVKANRGIYSVKDLTVSLADIFAFNMESREFKDALEIIVYPQVISIKNMKFDSTNFSGENTVRRWIQKDDLYIKGIREYTVQDRMKDIHWKSSLKLEKLMVKDYDFTSDTEMMIMFNIQCHKNHWQNVDEGGIENGIKVAASLACQSLKEGIPTGMCTNARIISKENSFVSEIIPANNNYKKILELCARIDYGMGYVFSDYLKLKKNMINKNCTYIIITSYLDDESIKFLKSLSKSKIKIKIIDISKDGSVESMMGIEKIFFRGMKI